MHRDVTANISCHAPRFLLPPRLRGRAESSRAIFKKFSDAPSAEREDEEEAIHAPGTVYHSGSEKCPATIQFSPYFAARDKSITR